MRALGAVLAGVLGFGVATGAQVVSDPCAMPALSAGERVMLGKYHVVRVQGELVLDPTLVADCEERGEVRLFVQHAWDGGLSVSDKLFAEKHGGDVNRAVLAVWPAIADSPAVPAEGAGYEGKWGILLQKEISDETVVELVSRNVERKGLGADAAFLLFSRALPQLNPMLRTVLVGRRATATEKLYAAALISRLDLERAGAAVRSVSRLPGLTVVERKTVVALGARFRANRPAAWEDVRMLSESVGASR